MGIRARASASAPRGAAGALHTCSSGMQCQGKLIAELQQSKVPHGSTSAVRGLGACFMFSDATAGQVQMVAELCLPAVAALCPQNSLLRCFMWRSFFGAGALRATMSCTVHNSVLYSYPIVNSPLPGLMYPCHTQSLPCQLTPIGTHVASDVGTANVAW